MGHTARVTFHLAASPQSPQAAPLYHKDEGRWVSFIWRIGLWGVKEDYFKATFQAELITTGQKKEAENKFLGRQNLISTLCKEVSVI